MGPGCMNCDANTSWEVCTRRGAFLPVAYKRSPTVDPSTPRSRATGDTARGEADDSCAQARQEAHGADRWPYRPPRCGGLLFLKEAPLYGRATLGVDVDDHGAHLPSKQQGAAKGDRYPPPLCHPL